MERKLSANYQTEVNFLLTDYLIKSNVDLDTSKENIINSVILNK